MTPPDRNNSPDPPTTSGGAAAGGMVDTGGGAYVEGSVSVVGGDFVGRDKVNVQNVQVVLSRMPREERLEVERQQELLDLVERNWITGVLEASLHTTAFLPLRMEFQPTAIEYALRGRLYVEGEPQHELPPNTTIVDVFDEARRSFLILGPPGSGKTTTMLVLLRVLIWRARVKLTDPTSGVAALPVVVEAARWNGGALDVWIVEELERLYGVGPELGRRWVAQGEVLPLLDALDEVPAGQRQACVEAINEYWYRHGATGIVVCCRTEEYKALRKKVQGLRTAVEVQPLTGEMIDAYLACGGEALEAARAVVRADAGLAELAQSPLMLSMMALAFRGAVLRELGPRSVEEWRERVFELFVRRMVDKPWAGTRFDAEQLLRGLRFLARRVGSGTVYYVEDFGLEELPRWARWGYRTGTFLAVTLIGGLIGALVGGLIGGLIGELGGELRAWQISGLVPGLGVGVAGGLLFGLDVGPVVGLGTGLGIGLHIASTGKWTVVERVQLRWSWLRFVQGLGMGLFFALVEWLNGKLHVWVGFELVGGLAGGVVLGLVFGLVFGLLEASEREDIRSRQNPNQGTWDSFRRGLVVGLVGWLIGELVGVLVGGLVRGPVGGLVGGLVFGLFFGLVGALLFGGGSVFVQHWVLRFVLWWGGWLPWDVVAFLDEAARRSLVLKVGGGYRFVHGLVQEYIADLELDHQP